MVIIAANLFGRTDTMSNIKIASSQDMDEIENRAKKKLADAILNTGMETVKIFSEQSLNNEKLMSKLNPILRSVAEEIAELMDPLQPELGYKFTRNDGEKVKIQKSEFWRAMNHALQQTLQGSVQ